MITLSRGGDPNNVPYYGVSGQSLHDCPGYIAFQIITWNNHNSYTNDYELDYFELVLKNGKGEEHRIAFIDILPEKNKSNHWVDLYNYEGNVHITDDENYYRNYNGNNTRYCHKYLYRDMDDGSQFCFFLTKYSDETYKFIKNANGNLTILLRGRWDDNEWHTFTNNTSEWKGEDMQFIPFPNDVTINQPSFANNSRRSELKIDVPAKDENASELVLSLYNSRTNKMLDKEVITSSGRTQKIWNLDVLNASKSDLENGVFILHAQQHRHYFPNRAWYHEQGLRILPEKVTRSSTDKQYYLPQVCLAHYANVVDNIDGTVTVTWDAPLPDENKPYDQSQWVVIRSTSPTFHKDSCKEFTMDYDAQKSRYSMTIPFDERNQGEKTYYFRVCRALLFTQQSPYYESCKLKVNTNYTEIQSFTWNANDRDISFKWYLNSGIWTSDMRLQLWKDNDRDPLMQTDNISENGEYVYSNLDYCTPSCFTLKLVNDKDALSLKKDTVMLPNTTPSILSSFRQSKGYYNDRIKLNWTIDKNGQNFDHFVLERKVYGADDKTYEYVSQKIQKGSNELDFLIIDKDINPGVYYQYRLTGRSSCAGNESTVGTYEGMGFAKPNGVVSGQVKFEGGQAVEGVTIDMTPAANESESGSSLDLSQTMSQARLQQKSPVFSSIGGTAELYVKLNDRTGEWSWLNETKKRSILYQDNVFELYTAEEYGDLILKLILCGEEKNYSTEVKLQSNKVDWKPNEFNHIAMSYRLDKNDLTLQLMVNGKLGHEYTYESFWDKLRMGDATKPIFIGNSYGHALYGFIDDLRFWNKYRTPEEISNTYNCYLSGKEDGLSGYYTFDMLINNETFDISGDGETFNENHLQVTNGACSMNVVPTTSQLGLRARTDKEGNYLINAVPYSSMGTLYSLVPTLGAHQFDPVTKTLVFDNHAITHNSIDFVDVSSFKVSGTIYYAGGTYPAKGIQFKVDGSTVLSEKGGAVQTDEEGHFTISVPVGVHSVQAYLDGHTLTDDGFITNHGQPIDFQEDLSNIKLFDSTRVRFVGRVCGGKEQADLPVGFSLSRNNLGDGLYVLLEHNHPDKYKLASQEWHDTLTHALPTIYALDSVNPHRKKVVHRNTVDYSENFIKIHVNDTTGEFYADVMPIQYTIFLSSNNYPKFDADGSQISFEGMNPNNQSSEPYTYNDSVATLKGDKVIYTKVSNITDTMKFAKKQVFPIRLTPQLDFYQVDNKGKRLDFFGVQSTLISNGNNRIEMQVYDATNKTQPYRLGIPLYEFSNSYLMEGIVCEIYHHYTEDGSIAWSDSVPTTDAVFYITNTMTKDREETVSADSLGRARYKFTIADPNLVDAKGQIALRVAYNNNASDLGWEPPFENGICYYTGEKKTSGDFITAGPNNLITILRDPPGSNSYAFLDKGHTIQKDRSYCYSSFENGKLGLDFQFGLDAHTVTGLGVAVITENKSTSTIKTGWEHDHKWSYNNMLTTTVTTTERISTSGDEVWVGANADVFVGAAYNYTLATVDRVQVVDSAMFRKYGTLKYTRQYSWTPDSAYVLTVASGISCGEKFKTTFNYTQRDIINEEIPRLEKMLKSLLLLYNKQDSIDYAVKASQTKECYYMLKPDFDPKKQEYGAPDTYFRIAPKHNNLHISSDTICTIYGWINGWKYYLGLNEYQKWKAFQNRSNAVVENYSVSGGGSMSLSEQYQTSRGYNYTYKNQNNFFVDHGQQQSNENTAYFGMSIVFQENAGNIKETNKTTTSSYTHTKGFAIIPSGMERLSVDVLRESDWSEGNEQEEYGKWEENHNDNTTENVTQTIHSLSSYPSYIFYTRGGQTCCPYEPEVKAHYLEYYLNSQIETLREIGEFSSAERYENELKKIKGKDVLINGPTIQVDKPQIKALTTYVEGVPSGEAAYVKIEMSNASESNADRPFYLVYKESSNNKGLAVSVDGTGIGTGLTGGSGVSFLIPANSTLQKTLTVTKGSALDYDDITLYLVASCDAYSNKFAIKDSCSFSIHFTPACSNIHIKTPNNGWVYNTELNTAVNPLNKKQERYLAVELDEFDVNYDEFDHIELQYKPSSDNDKKWKKIHYFYKDSTALKEAIKNGKEPSTLSLCKGGTIQYKLFLDDQDDQMYDLRAVTYCGYNSELVENYSDIVTGVKDVYCPRPFGAPKPADGILSIEDEILLEFNEEIAGGKLTYNNFSVSGILDDVQSDRNISVHLRGDGMLRSEDVFSLKNNFTLEGWFRQTGTEGQQALFTLGAAPDAISLLMDASNQQLFLDGDSIKRFIPIKNWDKGQWGHVALVCSQQETTQMPVLNVYINFLPVDQWTAKKDMFAKGSLVVGNQWQGDVDQIRVWSIPLDNIQLHERSNTHISNTSVGLVSCYNMDENTGTVLEDVSSERTMEIIRGTWAVPDGYALSFNGTSSYASIPMSESSLRADQDYTLEFWFRTEQKTSAVILSTGLTEGKLAANGMTIGINENGKLYVQNTDTCLTISDNKFSDHTWHHFTLSVGRASGFAHIYMDGVQTMLINQELLQGLAGAELYIGAQINRDKYGATNKADQNYKGELDELRLFGHYRPQYQLQKAVMEKVDSAAADLLFYYPMERYETSNINLMGLVYSPKNFCKGKQNEQMTIKDATQSKEAAPVITSAARTQLDQTGYTYTPNEKGIILTLIKPLSRIEHTILTFTASDVRDKNGNKMQSPVTWSAYVDRNPLVVKEKNIKQVTLTNWPKLFEIEVTNRSGSYQSFTLSGLPSWLTWQNESNTVAPNDKITLSFLSSESLPVGTHTAQLYLSNSDDVVIPVCLTLTILGDMPDVTIDTKNKPYTMNIIGQIQVNGIPSNDPLDVLYVYNDNECVGEAMNTYYKEFDTYYVQLTVYDKKTSGTNLHYVIYDASSGRIYEASSDANVQTFNDKSLVGTPANPVIFYTTDKQYRIYDLNKGWNWISFNVVPSGSEQWQINNVLQSATWNSGDLIKIYDTRTKADYSADNKQWMGTLTELNDINLFMMYLKKPVSLEVLGTPVNPGSVTFQLKNGWNTISYLPQVSLSVKEAMSHYTDIKNDVVIKSLTEFAIYYNGSWVGTLKTMKPGEGYMLYHKGDPTTFNYPSTYAFSKAPRRQQAVHHSTNMSLIAQPVGITAHEGDVLTAYCGAEAVGVAELTDGRWYMSIAGDQDASTLNFVYTSIHGQQKASTQMRYRAHAIVGSVESPEPIEFINSPSALVAYPSPAKAVLYYLLDGAKHYTIYSVTGECLQSGAATGCANVGSLVTGVYILEVSTDTDVYRTTFMKE